MRKSLVLTLAALPLAFFIAPVQGKSADLSSVSVALLMREPVLNFDVTGNTVLGGLHTRVTVYNDGLVTGSSCGGLAGQNSAGTTVVPVSAVTQLKTDLIDAGGLTLPDQPLLATIHVPLATVSVFNGTTNARCHTFSYWWGMGGAASEIDGVIANFIATYPVFCESLNQ